MLLLVRHAHAGEQHRWPRPGQPAAPSPAGQAEAAGLLARLEDYPVGRILSSPAATCDRSRWPISGP